MSSSNSFSFRATIAAGVVLGASGAMALNWLLSSIQKNPKKDVPKTNNSSKPKKSGGFTKAIPAELREEQLSRHTLYFGEEGMEDIRHSKVCVIGLGGVGSHTAVMLARGGVENLRLIDFDQVTLSSLNRHACATLADVGIPKVVCVKEFCHKIASGIIVDARVEMYTAESGPKLLAGEDWNMVIDCIDDVPTKAALLSYCLERKIRVLSCMGAGGKSDMTRLHISDLRTAAKDPLASKLRQTLKKLTKKTLKGDDSYLDDMDRLTIIYSSEKTVAKLADLTEEQKQQGDKSQFGAVDGMRIRVLPVLGPLPAIMGQSLASMALCELGKKPILQPVTGERLGRTVRHRKFQHLKRREEKITKGEILVPDGSYLTRGGVEIDIDDVEYIMGVWRNCCAVTGARLGTVLELVRWDLSLPTRPDNLVLMSSHAIEAYDKEGHASIPKDIQQRIEKRLAACREQNSELY